MSRTRWSLAVLLLVVAGCGGGGKKDAGTTTTTAPSLARSAATAAAVAKSALTVELSTTDVQTYVLDLCGAATSGDHSVIDDDLKRLTLASDADLRSTITALGKGAETYCPDGVRQSPLLLNDLYSEVAASVASSTSTSSTTAAAAATGASATSTTIDFDATSPGSLSGF